VDLGQKQDHTALAVVERAEIEFQERDPITFDWLRTLRYELRRVERIALGTPYPRVVERIERVAGQEPLAGRSTVVVDATGVGGPVVDLLRETAVRSRVMAVTITGGDRVTRSGMGYRAPKRDLISGLQVAFEQRSLLVARRMALADALVRELTSMRAGSFSAGSGHDDLVVAVALAWWGAAQARGGVFGVGKRLV
jgi:hypothetical protein